MSLEDRVTTIYEEATNIFVGDFGRLIAGEHPQINNQVIKAIREAAINSKVK
jgi:hypothetical protein